MAKATTAVRTFKPTIRRTRVAGVYRVSSRTSSGQVYTTNIRTRARPACNCPAGQNSFESCKYVRTCWHVRACEEFEDAQGRRALVVRPRRRQGLTAPRVAYA